MQVYYPFIILGFNVLIAAEYLYARGRKLEFYSPVDSWASISMYWGYVLVHLFWVGWIYAIYKLVHGFSPFAPLDGWGAWILLIFLEDFCFYVFHRTSHKLRFLWASHVNHHSSRYFNLTTAVRQTWTPFIGVVFWIPLILLGFSPEQVLLVQSISLLYQALLHTRAIPSFGPLGFVLNDPSHHRVHHGANEPYVDKNFGGVLIVWDRLFGTFEKENAPVIFGLHENIRTHNPLQIAFHEWFALFHDVVRANSIVKASIAFLRPLNHRELRSSSVKGTAETRPRYSGDDSRDNIGIIMTQALFLFLLVAAHEFILAPVNRSLIGYLLAALAGTVIVRRVKYNADARGFTRTRLLAVVGVGLWAVILAFPFLYHGLSPAVSWIAPVTATLNIILSLKIVAFLNDAEQERDIFSDLYFFWFAPVLSRTQFKTRPVVPGSFPVRRNGTAFSARFIAPLFSLVGLAVGLLLLVGFTAVPLEFYAAGPREGRFWILLFAKGLCLLLIFKGAAAILRAYWSAVGMIGRQGPRRLIGGPADFWRRLNPALSAWLTRYTRPSLRRSLFFGVLSAFTCVAVCMEYFLAAAGGRAGYASLFFLIQGLVVYLDLVLRMRRGRPGFPASLVAGLFGYGQLFLTSALFFRAWDGIFR